MRKIAFIIASLLTLLAGCTNDDLMKEAKNDATTYRSDKVRWYGTNQLNAPTTKGVADQSKLWNASTPIRVKFLNAPADIQIVEKIKTYAKEWEQYAGISFDFVPKEEKAVIRIAFDWEYNDWLTWSFTGNQAQAVLSQNQPTAVFGGMDYLSDEEIRGDALRIFGQILGLEYEQRHMDWDDSVWKKDRNGEYYAQQYWEGMFYESGFDFDWDIIRQFVFDPMAGASVAQTEELDMESIMLWPYYTRRESTQLVANYDLSEQDKLFIALLYPKKNTLPTIQNLWVDAGFMEWRTKENTGAYYWYDGMVGLKLTELGRQQGYLPDVCDGEQLNSAYEMFSGSYTGGGKYLNPVLKEMPKFNTSNITDFSGMFYRCNNLTSIPELDTSNGRNFGGMFMECHSLTSIPELDTSESENFSGMFSFCYSLTSIPKLDTSHGRNFDGMFSCCFYLTSIPELDTSKGESFNSMFTNCGSLTSITKLNTSNGHTFDCMFDGCHSLTSIPDLETSNGQTFHRMFEGCFSLTSIPELDTSKGQNFERMFNGCHSLTSIPYLETVRGEYFYGMFNGCHSLTHIPFLNISNANNLWFDPNLGNDPEVLNIFEEVNLEHAEISGLGGRNDAPSIFKIESPSLSIYSVEFLIEHAWDRTQFGFGTIEIHLSTNLESQIYPELTARAKEKGYEFVFTTPRS